MNGDLLTHDEIAEELRALAMAAAPAVHARPDLAESVLNRARGGVTRRRSRQVGIAVGSGLLVLAIAAASRPGGGTHFAIVEPSAAMEPTVAVGDHVTFDKRLAAARGDVVYVHVAAPGLDHEIISRVVAEGGDTIECPPALDGTCQGLVVNGTPAPEPHLGVLTMKPFSPMTVPSGDLFILGDNRNSAIDSRIFGPIPADAVSGVGVSLSTKNQASRPIPGAPSHPAPHGNDSVDPADFPPKAESAG
jgi:signal peptidase I